MTYHADEPWQPGGLAGMYLVGRHDGQMQPFFVKLRHDGGMELPGRALCIDERVKGPDYWWHSMAVPKTLPDLAKLPPFTPEGQ